MGHHQTPCSADLMIPRQSVTRLENELVSMLPKVSKNVIMGPQMMAFMETVRHLVPLRLLVDVEKPSGQGYHRRDYIYQPPRRVLRR